MFLINICKLDIFQKTKGLIIIFADRLRSERELLGLKQKEMAKELNIPANTYNGYETGKRTPNLEVANSIAKHLNISLDYLLGNTDKRNYNTSSNLDDEIIKLAELLKSANKDKIEAVKNYLEISSTEDKHK